MKFGTDDKGLSLIEVLVAMAVLLIGILAIIKIFPEGLAGIERTRFNDTVAALAVYQMEEVASWDFNDISISRPEPEPNGIETEFYINMPVSSAFWAVTPQVELKKSGSMTYALPVGGASVLWRDQDEHTGQELKITFLDTPETGDSIRVSFALLAWRDLAQERLKISGLGTVARSVSTAVFVSYMDAAGNESATPTDYKQITAGVYWLEGGKERSLTRSAVIRKRE